MMNTVKVHATLSIRVGYKPKISISLNLTLKCCLNVVMELYSLIILCIVRKDIYNQWRFGDPSL